MSEASWDEIQAIKTKRLSIRERMEKRKKERQDILHPTKCFKTDTGLVDDKKSVSDLESDTEVEKCLLQILSDVSLILPANSKQIANKLSNLQPTPKNPSIEMINYFLQKFASQKLISIKDVSIGKEFGYEIIQVEQANVVAMYNDKIGELDLNKKGDGSILIKVEKNDAKVSPLKINSTNKSKETLDNTSDIMSLLLLPSTREKQNKQVGEEILELLSKPTAKERSLAEKFKSQGGAQVMEFCPHGTKSECLKALQLSAENEPPVNENLSPSKETSSSTTTTTVNAVADDKVKNEISNPPLDSDKKRDLIDRSQVIPDKYKCSKLHFKKIIQGHTDESLGDCSFLNTCFHMDTCKYVHYEVDTFVGVNPKPENEVVPVTKRTIDSCSTLYPPQWIQCDLRYLDMTVLGKFAVIMADPPWDIHMELPYGTMSDDEMRQLGVPALQDDGLIFLWVTGRAMELGRECLKLWGYERVDELIWVKTNQLQRIIRTGRTGHWLNHGKEHCLVGMKGNPTNLNRGLDSDVIVAEVRATSHKPDEIYGIIERLSPGTRKIELFGRPHNVQCQWITLGNQLDGIRLVDPELINSFQKRYPDGNCMAPSSNSK